MPEDLAHQPLGPVAPDRPADSARRDDSQPAPVQTVRKREQNQIAALDADTLPLHAEELPSPSDPVVPGESSIHVSTGGRPETPVSSRLRTRPCCVLRRTLLGDGKTLPTLRPPPAENFPAGLRAHALAKSVRPLAPPVVWLIRALHALIILAARLRGHTQTANEHGSHQAGRMSTATAALMPVPAVLFGCRRPGTVVHFPSRPRRQLPPTQIFSTGCGRNCGKWARRQVDRPASVYWYCTTCEVSAVIFVLPGPCRAGSPRPSATARSNR